MHPLLVTGGSEGSLLHWDLSLPDPALPQTLSQPRATLSQAHDSNVWALAFHPLGHLLVSASNDHTTRFWSRERPGDASSVFSGGGEKPPAVVDTSQQDEEEAMVPGFGGGWWAKDEEPQGFGLGPPGADGPYGQRNGFGPGGGGGGSGGGGGQNGGGQNGAEDEFVLPGLGGGAEGAGTFALGRQSGPLPPQEDVFGGDAPTGHVYHGGGSGPGEEDWQQPRRGGGNRGQRWGPRRGRY